MPDSKLIQFQDAQFWRTLCPALTVNEFPLAQRSNFGSDNPLRPDEWETCKATINQDGYFAYDGWFDRGLIDRMADCFLRLEAANIHPVFAFVYDEFWDLLLQMKPLFSDLLGDYECLPAVWSWFVRADSQTAFSPHRDQVREVFIEDEDHLDYLTVWIPLVDLNHLSSYMCLLPASLDADYEECTPEIRVENLQDVRSLQGSAGSLFCWCTQVAHWGTKQSEHGPPRMSVGFYLQRSGAESMDDGPPLDFSKPLSLDQRLAIIGQQIIDYSRTATEDELRFASLLVGGA